MLSAFGALTPSPRVSSDVCLQAVRALELIGREVDKAKYAALLEDARARQTDAQSMDRPQHNRTWAAYQRRRDARRKNVQLERFKWLLGLPNRWARPGFTWRWVWAAGDSLLRTIWCCLLM